MVILVSNKESREENAQVARHRLDSYLPMSNEYISYYRHSYVTKEHILSLELRPIKSPWQH